MLTTLVKNKETPLAKLYKQTTLTKLLWNKCNLKAVPSVGISRKMKMLVQSPKQSNLFQLERIHHINLISHAAV